MVAPGFPNHGRDEGNLVGKVEILRKRCVRSGDPVDYLCELVRCVIAFSILVDDVFLYRSPCGVSNRIRCCYHLKLMSLFKTLFRRGNNYLALA